MELEVHKNLPLSQVNSFHTPLFLSNQAEYSC